MARFRVDLRGSKRGALVSDLMGLKVRNVTLGRSPDLRVTLASSDQRGGGVKIRKFVIMVRSAIASAGRRRN